MFKKNGQDKIFSVKIVSNKRKNRDKTQKSNKTFTKQFQKKVHIKISTKKFKQKVQTKKFKPKNSTTKFKKTFKKRVQKSSRKVHEKYQEK